MFKFDNATYIHILLYLLTFLNGQPIKKKNVNLVIYVLIKIIISYNKSKNSVKVKKNIKHSKYYNFRLHLKQHKLNFSCREFSL